jgi:hypothetical protein
LLAGTILGARAWTLLGAGDGGRPLLGSMASSSYWPPGAPLRSRCDRAGTDPAHRAPAGECGCGIYAWHPSRAAASPQFADGALWTDAERPTHVAGVIEAWGRIEVHRDGFRAERARPVTLFVDPAAAPEHRHVIERLAAAYGASMIQIAGASDFQGYLRELPGGLDPGAVDALLCHTATVALRPEAVGLLSGRRPQAIGGSGFVLEGEGPPDRWRPQLPLDLPGVRLARVAGAAYRPHALQDPAFAPGRAVRLLPEPRNMHDPNAIGIWDEALRLRAGYVPAELAPEVGRMLREGNVRRAMSVWQWRDLETGERIGLHVLLSASDRVVFRRSGKKRGERIVAEEIEW